MNDLVIIGGGPAGVAAGVYASRKRLKSVLITVEWGGQSVVSPEIQNWIGTKAISGTDLAKNLREHLEAYASGIIDIVSPEKVVGLKKATHGFTVKTDSGKEFSARTVLICSGGDRRRLEVPGAAKFEHKGLTYCASCDGPLFAGMDTAVIGGGNAGFETAAQLLAYAKSVTLLTHGDFRADPVTVEKVLADPKMKAIKNADILEVKGDGFVTALRYKEKNLGEEKELPVSGIFVEIGLVPNTSFAKGVLEFDQIERIKVDARNQRTSVEGVWAAGDCTDELYHQNNIAAGDAIKALEDIYLYLKTK